MRTNFTSNQLKDPQVAKAEQILRKCVHCGFCTATCSTYVMVGDERDSPRGRIYLMKDMFENSKPASPEVQYHVDRCLSCLSCMTTCPSSVDYMHLVDLARVHIEKTGSRSLKEKIIRNMLAAILPHPSRMRLALWLAPLGKPFRSIFRKIGLKEVAAMLDLAPSVPPGLFRWRKKVAPPAVQTYSSKRVALLMGCAQKILRPEINEATRRVLERQGVDVIVPPQVECCGALVHHMGREAQAVQAAKRNVDAWYELMRDEPLDAIIINASGCGTMVKDYGHVLENEPGYARRAEEVASVTMDITEFLSRYDFAIPENWSSLQVAYHGACSLQHGQKVTNEPRQLLRQSGFTVLDVPEGHICCGSAGTYNILQPELSNELLERKVNNIESLTPDIIAAGNIGCITQIAKGTDLPVVHSVELIDWALGGPCPKELKHLEAQTQPVRGLFAEVESQQNPFLEQ